ncbi:MAG: pilus assembly protein PilM [Candidatus Omnitrophota bacterium]
MQIRKNIDIISLDLSHDELMLAHYKNTGKQAEFVDLINQSIQGLSDDKIAQLIFKEITDLKIKNPYIINVIPLHLAITKNLEIPSLDDQEIREIIDLQSGRQTPYSRDEIIVDYINLGVVKQSYSKILLVIVVRKAVKRQFDLIDKAGFKTQRVIFAPETISKICTEQIRKEVQEHPVAILHMGLAFTDFIVSFKGMPIFLRTIPIGTKQITLDKQKSTIDFIEELKKSLETYQSEDIDQAPGTLILTGATEYMGELRSELAMQVFIPIQVIPYFECVPVSKIILETISKNKHISFFNLTSAVLKKEDAVLNLIPDEIKLKISFEQRIQELVKMCVYFLGILLLVGAIFMAKLYFKGEYLSRLKAKNESFSQEAKVLEKSMERMRVIKHYLKARGYSLEILAALCDILPKDIMVSNIKMDQEKNLNIKGTGRAMSSVFSFVSALEDSEFFSNVNTNYTTSRKQDDEDWADFGITCMIIK